MAHRPTSLHFLTLERYGRSELGGEDPAAGMPAVTRGGRREGDAPRPAGEPRASPPPRGRRDGVSFVGARWW